MMEKIIVTIVILGLLLRSNLCKSEPSDELEKLPDYETDEVQFNQYSGYLNGSSDGDVQLHYWLVESQRNATNDSLVLWLNGGPGTSSLFGFFYEHGPFKLNENGTLLTDNPHSWNKIANIIYLESPVCVGYSFSRKGSCSCNDTAAAEQNYQALVHFLEKFPAYKETRRDLYITGQSYAAIYLTLLAQKIIDSHSILAQMLKGVAIGNGLFNRMLNKNSKFLFGFGHGLLSYGDFVRLVKTCNCTGNPLHCDYWNGSEDCINERTRAMETIRNVTNRYNILDVTESIKGEGAERWMNSEKVRRALNIFNSSLNWTVTSKSLNYSQMVYSDNFQTVYSEDFQTVFDIKENVQSLVSQSSIRILIYNGDLDSVCNFLGAQIFMQSLGFPSNASHVWHTNNGHRGGLMTQHSDNLHFAVVRGAGHSVAKDRPEAAFSLFEKFISHSEFSL